MNKFRYRDKVDITGGFYEGFSGMVVEYRPHVHMLTFPDILSACLVELDVDSKSVWVLTYNLEHVK